MALYQCSDSQIVLRREEVGDGVEDCPFGDDERIFSAQIGEVFEKIYRTETKSSDGGIGAGGVAAIVIVSLVLLLILEYAVWKLYVTRRQPSQQNPQVVDAGAGSNNQQDGTGVRSNNRKEDVEAGYTTNPIRLLLDDLIAKLMNKSDPLQQVKYNDATFFVLLNLYFPRLLPWRPWTLCT